MRSSPHRWPPAAVVSFLRRAARPTVHRPSRNRSGIPARSRFDIRRCRRPRCEPTTAYLARCEPEPARLARRQRDRAGETTRQTASDPASRDIRRQPAAEAYGNRYGTNWKHCQKKLECMTQVDACHPLHHVRGAPRLQLTGWPRHCSAAADFNLIMVGPRQRAFASRAHAVSHSPRYDAQSLYCARSRHQAHLTSATR